MDDSQFIVVACGRAFVREAVMVDVRTLVEGLVSSQVRAFVREAVMVDVRALVEGACIKSGDLKCVVAVVVVGVTPVKKPAVKVA